MYETIRYTPRVLYTVSCLNRSYTDIYVSIASVACNRHGYVRVGVEGLDLSDKETWLWLEFIIIRTLIIFYSRLSVDQWSGGVKQHGSRKLLLLQAEFWLCSLLGNYKLVCEYILTVIHLTVVFIVTHDAWRCVLVRLTCCLALSYIFVCAIWCVNADL